jgi:hypothetical protein
VRFGALAVCVLASALASPAHAQLAVDQVEMHLAPESPDRRVALFNVTNESARTIEASLYLEDWDRSETGANRFYKTGTLPGSCGTKLRIFPASISLAAGASQAVRITLDGADSLAASCWAIAFVETVQRPDAAPRQGHAITYVMRTGVKIYVEPGMLGRDGAVTHMAVRPRTTPPAAAASRDAAVQELAVIFRNTGGIQVKPRGSVEFRRPDNSLAAKAEVEEFPVLPSAARAVVVPVPRLQAGRYVALALFDFGGQDIAAGQLEFEVR